MQLKSILALIVATIAATNAAECSYSQITALSSDPVVAQGNAVCAENAVDINSMTSSNMKAICKNTKCMDAVKASLAIIPNCELQGQNLQAAFKKVISTCETASSSAPRTAGSGATAAAATAVVAAAVIAYGRL